MLETLVSSTASRSLTATFSASPRVLRTGSAPLMGADLASAAVSTVAPMPDTGQHLVYV
ncbi:hypothetical protein CH063_15129 [Colletotrichum higginsianum]|uniref:Uncharacterized protein n=1 Tax=Colletotrichum higginsianum (strain IMI 349063) TaxID=759273 RepID=H1W1I7_COLHI|nr:hypothetical protein CH063_15129 [Colletotrichum higginsianum]